MSRNVDWKQAMLNEAEASGDEGWAEETRKASSGLRYFGHELLRLGAVYLLFGLLGALLFNLAPSWFTGSLYWAKALALSVVAFTVLGACARWFAGDRLDAFNVVIILGLMFRHMHSLEQWPLQGWEGFAAFALPMAAGFFFGQWLGHRWQPFGAWRPYNPADFAEK